MKIKKRNKKKNHQQQIENNRRIDETEYNNNFNTIPQKYNSVSELQDILDLNFYPVSELQNILNPVLKLQNNLDLITREINLNNFNTIPLLIAFVFFIIMDLKNSNNISELTKSILIIKNIINIVTKNIINNRFGIKMEYDENRINILKNKTEDLEEILSNLEKKPKE